MKIKYSALVSGVSGKLNGSVGATNRGGAYLRNKGVVTNPQTVSQQANRSLFGSISSQFRNLSAGQIAAWNAAAQTFPYTDTFGDVRYLSGASLFLQLNKNLVQAGQAVIVEPPAKVSFPNIVGATFTFNIGAAIGSQLSAEIETGTSGLEDFAAEFKFTKSVSTSVSYVKNLFRLIGYETGPAVGTSIGFSDVEAYTAIFGTPIVGQKVVVEIALVSLISGERSAPFQATALVVNEP